MNIYDFDDTIYDGDSTIDFYKFTLIRHPSVLLRLPAAAFAAMKYKLGKCSKTEFKARFFAFLKCVPNVEREVADFWSKKAKRIKPFYFELHRPDDIVISASPEFLLKDICTKLGIGTLIASDVDSKTGAFRRENCHGPEKVKRLHEALGHDINIEEFYSDSRSDLPLAELAKKAFLVKGDKITEWRTS